MICASSSMATVAGQFSDPNVDAIGGVKITKLPPGEALGSSDLQRWAQNRLRGRSGIGISIEKTAAGWVVSLPSGKTIGPFKKRRDAWDWIKRHPSRRRGR